MLHSVSLLKHRTHSLRLFYDTWTDLIYFVFINYSTNARWIKVNKPFRRLVYRRIMPEAERLSEKRNSWPRSETSRAPVKFWWQSFSQRHYPPIYQQARKGFIYFITLRFISTVPAPYCGEEKTDTESVTVQLQLIKSKLAGLLDFITLWLDLKS